MGTINVAIQYNQLNVSLSQLAGSYRLVDQSQDKFNKTMDRATNASLKLGSGMRNLMIGQLFAIFSQERLVESMAGVGQAMLAMNETMIRATFLAQDWGQSNLDAAMSSQAFKDVSANVEQLTQQYEQLVTQQAEAVKFGRLSPQYLSATARIEAFNIANPGFQEDRQKIEQTKLMKDQVMSAKLQLAMSELTLVENQRIAQLSEQILEVMTVMSAAQIGFEIGMGTMVPGAGTIGALGGLTVGVGVAAFEHMNFMDFQNKFSGMVDKLSNMGDSTDNLDGTMKDLITSIKDLTKSLSPNTTSTTERSGGRALGDVGGRG